MHLHEHTIHILHLHISGCMPICANVHNICLATSYITTLIIMRLGSSAAMHILEAFLLKNALTMYVQHYARM